MASGFSNAMKGLKEGAGDFVDKHKDEVIEKAKDALSSDSNNDNDRAMPGQKTDRSATNTRERGEPRTEDRRRQEDDRDRGTDRKEGRSAEGKPRTQERPRTDKDPDRRDR